MSDPHLDIVASPGGDEPSPAPMSGFAGKAAFYAGSAGLLLATAADAIAVLGRHVGFTFLGAIEIVQAAIVFIAASSMIAVTLTRGHAAVHILTDRLQPPRRASLARVSSLLAVIAVLLLAAGSMILLADLWNGHERSELIHIPLRWFRVAIIGALLFVALLFGRQVFERGQHDA